MPHTGISHHVSHDQFSIPRWFQTLGFVLTDSKEILNISFDFQKGLKGGGGGGRWVIDKIFHLCPSSPLCSVAASALPSPYQGQGYRRAAGCRKLSFCHVLLARRGGCPSPATSVTDFQRAAAPSRVRQCMHWRCHMGWVLVSLPTRTHIPTKDHPLLVPCYL